MMKIFSISLAALAFFGCCILSGCMVKSETLTAMLNAAEALRLRDYKMFEKYVDLDALLAQSVDLTVDEVQRHGGKWPPILEDATAFAKPIIIKETRKAFEMAVKTGTLNKAAGMNQLPSLELLGKMVGLFGAPQAQANYEIKDVQTAADGELLKINVKTNKNDPWLPLQIRSKKEGDHYRIVKIENLGEVYKQIMNQIID